MLGIINRIFNNPRDRCVVQVLVDETLNRSSGPVVVMKNGNYYCTISFVILNDINNLIINHLKSEKSVFEASFDTRLEKDKTRRLEPFDFSFSIFRRQSQRKSK